jgi:hypothetical protein
MSALKSRIATNHQRAPDLAPAGDGLALGGSPPGALVTIEPGVGAGLGPLSPIIASDGAAIPATGPGRWDQLTAAGRG